MVPAGEPWAYVVSWFQTGLHGDEPWWVNISYVRNLTPIGPGDAEIDAILPNGTYNWSAGTTFPGARVVSPSSGSFTIQGNSPTDIYLVFTVPNASVTFEETGLNPVGEWEVILYGPMFASGSGLWESSPAFSLELDSGAYNFSIVPPGGEESGVRVIPSTGTLNVGVTPISVSIRLVAPPVFGVTFAPRFEGTGPVDWSAEVFDVFYVNGSGAFTPGSHLFANGTTSAPPVLLANGTYVFRVTVPGGYSAVPSGGSLHVNGTGGTVNVTISMTGLGGPFGWGLAGYVVVGTSAVVLAILVVEVARHLRRKHRSALPN
jgi:hypothetical protein